MTTRFDTAKRMRRVFCIAATLLAVAGIAEACSVPVFRYAIDHWLPDAFRIQVLHQGALSEADSALVQYLKDRAAARFANVVVEEVDLQTSDDPALAARFEESQAGDGPVCFVQGPTGKPDEYRDVWSGPFTGETVDALLASPVREQLVKQLLAGDSVVWIYLESGESPVDDANCELLETELARLEEELELPEIDEVDLKELSTSPDELKLQFSFLRLSRDNPEEALLVETLLSSEPDLRDEMFVNEPMAFPVFGRGRVLYSLVGKGITAGLIEDACRFLTGACQCTVKEQNPGTDLLLAVDWDGLISPTPPTEVDVTLTGLAGFQSDSAADAATAVDSTAGGGESSADEAEDGESSSAPEVVLDNATPELSGSTHDAAPPAETVSTRTVERPAEEAASSWFRPGVLVAILAVVVVVGSFFLIPRH